MGDLPELSQILPLIGDSSSTVASIFPALNLRHLWLSRAVAQDWVRHSSHGVSPFRVSRRTATARPAESVIPLLSWQWSPSRLLLTMGLPTRKESEYRIVLSWSLCDT